MHAIPKHLRDVSCIGAIQIDITFTFVLAYCLCCLCVPSCTLVYFIVSCCAEQTADDDMTDIQQQQQLASTAKDSSQALLAVDSVSNRALVVSDTSNSLPASQVIMLQTRHDSVSLLSVSDKKILPPALCLKKIIACLIFYNLKKLEPMLTIFGLLVVHAEGPSF